MPTVVIALQTIYYFYINGGLTLAQFVKIKAGGRVLHALLKRAYDFQLEVCVINNKIPKRGSVGVDYLPR